MIQLQKELEALKANLEEKESSLPAHSVRPHQLHAIEELEDQIVEKEKILSDLMKRQN